MTCNQDWISFPDLSLSYHHCHFHLADQMMKVEVTIHATDYEKVMNLMIDSVVSDRILYGTWRVSDDRKRSYEWRCRLVDLPLPFDGISIPTQMYLILQNLPLWINLLNAFSKYWITDFPLYWIAIKAQLYIYTIYACHTHPFSVEIKGNTWQARVASRIAERSTCADGCWSSCWCGVLERQTVEILHAGFQEKEAWWQLKQHNPLSPPSRGN